MQQPSQNAGDQTSSFFWYVVLLAVAFIAVWFFGKKYLVPPLFYLRAIEVHLLLWVLDAWNMIAGFLHLPLADTARFDYILQFMQGSNPAKISLDQVEDMSSSVGNYYRYPIMAAIAGLAYLSYFKHRSALYVNNYTMKSLKNLEVSSWPEILPVASLDLVKQDLNTGPWAMAKLPLDFCKEHNLLRVTEKNEKPVWSVVHGAAERMFVLQMGPLWDGVDHLPIHIKALIIIFITRISREKELALDLLAQISKSKDPLTPDFSRVEQLCKKYQSHKVLKWVTSRHGYVYTVMATLLEIARVEGVLATAEFIWLKPIDRRLWYVLSNVGRSTPFVEVAGIYAHWLTEKKLRRSLSTPMVTEAVIALDKAVGEVLYTDIGESWHTSNVA